MLAIPSWRRCVLIVALLFSTAAFAQNVDMSASISDTPDPVTLGTNDIVYTATLTNASSGVSATNPTLTVTVPSGSTVQSASANFSGSCNAAGNPTIVCTWSSFTGFSSRTATITISPGSGGILTATAVASANEADPTPANNSASTSTSVNASIDLQLLSVSDTPDPITLGQGNVTYSAVVYNASSSKATNAYATITLPPSAVFVTATANLSGTCTAPSGGVLTCSWAGDLTSGGQRTATITVTPTAGGVMTLSATAAGDQPDANPGNNINSAGTTVNGSIDLRLLSISDTPDPITLGQGDVTYTVNIYNQSSSKATNPKVDITIPAASTFVSATANVSGTCGAISGGVFTCNWAGDLTSGAQRSVTVVVTPTAGGVATLSATVDGDQPDDVPTNDTLTASTTVNGSIDLRLLGINDTPDPITLGQGNITYTVSIYNQSSSKATNAKVDITIPAASTFVTATASNSGTCGAISGGVFTCNWAGDLTSGAQRTVTVVVTPTAGGVATLSATVDGDQPDDVPANDTLTASTTVNEFIDMRVLSTHDTPDPITLGQGNITYTVNIYNQSSSKATNAVATLTLPASSTFVTATASNSGTCSAPSGGVFTCSWAGDFASGAQRSITIVVTPTAGGTATLTASIDADQPDNVNTNDSATESTTVNEFIDLRVLSMSDTPDPITLGTGNITYTATLYNASSSKATNAVATITLPATATFVSASATNSGTCSAPSGGVLTCAWAGDLTSGATRTVTVIVTPTAGGTHTLTVAIDGDQPDNVNANDTGNESTTVNAQIDVKILSISDTPDPITLGTGNITYSITIYNHSSSKATNAKVDLTFPLSSTLVSATATNAGTCAPPAGNVIPCSWPGDLTSGATRTVTLVLTPTAGGTHTVSATVDADQPDPDATNDTASQSTTVNEFIDLRVLSISDSPDPITLGTGDVTYSVTIYNSATSKATNVATTITLPATATFVSATPNVSGTCTAPAGGVFTCSWAGDLTSGGTRTVTVVVTPTAGGTHTLSASVDGDQPDNVNGNDTLTQSTTVNAQLELQLSVNDSPDPRILGAGSVTYSVNAYNAGSSKATNPNIVFTFPATATYVSATPSAGGTCTLNPGVSVSCSWADIASGSSRSTSIVLTPLQVGQLSTVATLSATQGDPNPANNSETETTNINPSTPPTVSGFTPGSGPVGTVVSITGTNFFSTTSVKFNGFSSTFIVNSNTSITATVPAGATTGLIGVTNAAGNASSVTNFTVTPAPDLSIAKTASLPTVPTGAAFSYVLAVTNTGLGAANDVTVTDTLPAGVTLQSIVALGWSCSGTTTITCTQGPLASLVPANVITLNVTAPATGTTVTNTATVTSTTPDANPANNSSTVSVGVIGCPGTPAITAPATVCANSTGHTASTPAVPGATYNWTINNGTITSGATSNVVTFDAAGATPVTLSVDVFVTACPTVSNSATVNVSAPVATITPDGPTTFCTGGSVTLAANNGASWLWSNGATTQSIFVTSGGTFTVDVTDAAGCTVTSPPATVTVNATPVATITASGPTTFCAGGSVTLNAPAGMASYNWSNGATTPSIVVNTNENVFVQVTNASGCTATSAPVTVTVTAPPIATITPSGPTTFCIGGSVTLNASAGASWLWSNGATTPSITVSAAGSYSVTVTDASGCSATSAATNVVVNPAPTASITAGGPTTFCAGGSVTLTAVGGTSWLWSNGATTSSLTVSSGGAYSVTVTDGSGCSTTSAPMTVTVTNPVTPVITGPTASCANSTVLLDAGPGFATYAWSNGAATQQIAVSPTSTTTYSVTTTDGSGCSASDSHTVTVTANPIAAIATPANVCESSAGNNASVAAQPGATYAWTIGNGTITAGAGTNAITFTAGPAGAVNLGVTVTTGSCITTGNAAIPIAAYPSVTISGPAQVCPNTNFTLTADGGPFATYLWSNGATGPSITLNQNALSTTYSVTVTNAAGCASSTSHVVTLVSQPDASIAAPASAPPFSSLTASVPPQPGATFLWSILGGTITAGQGTDAISFTTGASGTTNLTVQVTAANCSASGGVAIVIADNEPPPCETQPATLTAPAENATVSSPALLQWTAVLGATSYDVWINGALAGNTSATSLSVPLPSGPATWHVIANLGGACNPLASAPRTFTVQASNDCNANARPQLSVPATSTSPVTFNWSFVPNAIGYRVLISVDGAAPEDIGGTTGATTLTASIPPGAIAAYVEALFSGCAPTRSDAVLFTILATDACATRTAAVPVAPAHNATINSSSVLFRWSPAIGATAYRIWASIDGAAPAVLGTTTDTTLRATLERGAVEWFVEALYEGCASTESQHFRFTIPAAQNCGTARPNTIAPANGSIVTNASVTFSWSGVEGAIGYEVYLSLDGGTPVLLGSTIGATSLTRTVPAGELQWFVRALVDRCPSRDSQSAAFTVDLPAACDDRVRPVIIEPLANVKSTSPLTFAWSAVDGATNYELYVIRGNAPAQLVRTTTGTQANSVALDAGKLRWFVRANFAQDCPALDSAEQALEIVPAPAACAPLPAPVITAPGQVSEGTRLRIQWSPVAGASLYQIQIADNNAFTGAQLTETSATQVPFTVTNAQPIHARVRAIDGRCATANASAFSAPAVIFVLPAASPEGSAPLADPTPLTFTFNLGAEYAGQNFNATTRQPWLTITPASGVVGAQGTTLNVVANTKTLPVGTSLGAISVTLASSAGRVAANSTSSVSGNFSVTMVTPVTPDAGSTPPPDALIIPAVAHADGINSHFQSDVRVSNTSARLMTYQVTFTPSGDSGITQGQQSTFSVEPGRTVALDDVLKSWFGTGEGSAMGTLEIRPVLESASATNALASFVTFASSRTFNVTANGTFGQYIPAIPFANFVGRERILSLQQIAQSSQYRTNLGLVEASGNPVSLSVRVFGQTGQYLTDFPVDLRGGQHLQLNSFLRDNGVDDLSDGRVEVEVVSGDGKITAYASVLDNNTSDPLLVTPVTVDSAGGTKWVVPGVADLASGFANWQTDMRLFNAGTEDVETTLTFHSQGGGEPKVRTLTIPAGQVRQFDKTLASLFETTNDGGAVHITTTNPAKLIATARTYNQTSGGTYGQFISAVTTNEAAGVESRPLQLLQVEESDRFRSNIGLVEVTGQPVKVEISVVPPDAKITAVTELTLQPNEFRQLGSLLTSMGLEGTHNARVTVKAIEGTGRVSAYASVIDMRTNDPTYVPAQ